MEALLWLPILLLSSLSGWIFSGSALGAAMACAILFLILLPLLLGGERREEADLVRASDFEKALRSRLLASPDPARRRLAAGLGEEGGVMPPRAWRERGFPANRHLLDWAGGWAHPKGAREGERLALVALGRVEERLSRSREGEDERPLSALQGVHPMASLLHAFRSLPRQGSAPPHDLLALVLALEALDGLHRRAGEDDPDFREGRAQVSQALSAMLASLPPPAPVREDEPHAPEPVDPARRDRERLRLALSDGA